MKELLKNKLKIQSTKDSTKDKSPKLLSSIRYLEEIKQYCQQLNGNNFLVEECFFSYYVHSNACYNVCKELLKTKKPNMVSVELQIDKLKTI